MVSANKKTITNTSHDMSQSFPEIPQSFPNHDLSALLTLQQSHDLYAFSASQSFLEAPQNCPRHDLLALLSLQSFQIYRPPPSPPPLAHAADYHYLFLVAFHHKSPSVGIPWGSSLAQVVWSPIRCARGMDWAAKLVEAVGAHAELADGGHTRLYRHQISSKTPISENKNLDN